MPTLTALVLPWLLAFIVAPAFVAGKVEVTKVNKATDIIVQSKQHRLLAIGLASNDKDIKTFKSMAQGFSKGTPEFMYSQDKDIFERYDLEEQDLPAMIILRNFNDAGKDLKNRRDTVKYVKSDGEWKSGALREFILKEGVAPIVTFPANGPDEQATLSLAFDAQGTKMFMIWQSKDQRAILDKLYENNADETPSKYFRKVTSFSVDWSSMHDEAKKQLKTMIGEDEIEPPMAIVPSERQSLKGGDLTIAGVKKMLDAAMGGGGVDSDDDGELDRLEKELKDALEQKEKATEEEDYERAGQLKKKVAELKAQIAKVDGHDEL